MKSKWIKKLFKIVFITAVCVVCIALTLNFYVILSAKPKICYIDDGVANKVDCIVVLGCGLKAGGKPSKMLEDRLNTGIQLYKMGISDKILMSGDHGSVYYDEVGTMKKYAIEQGVKSEDIFLDHAGFSTYESMYRAKEIFGLKNIIVVTQQYHIYRAVFIANNLGINVLGIPCKKVNYSGQFFREIREIFARDKDVFSCWFSAKPKYLGESIPVTNGNGDITNG